MLKEKIKALLEAWGQQIPITLGADFSRALDLFIKDSQSKIEKYQKENVPNVPVPKLIPKIGQKYVKIITLEPGQSLGAAWAFIDVDNGDILKPATYAAPAKGERGNIFKQDTWKTVTRFGPAYKYR